MTAPQYGGGQFRAPVGSALHCSFWRCRAGQVLVPVFVPVSYPSSRNMGENTISAANNHTYAVDRQGFNRVDDADRHGAAQKA